MNFEKLKETARKYEQKEEWRRAIEVYLQAIREFEAGNDPVPDLSVYNRIGDLYLKANEPGAAVQAYERAADLYGEQGFYNNAIALCGKILRVNPGRIQTYLKLAHLHGRKNVVIEAKKNLLEYLERMNALNQLDEAFNAVKSFADQFPGNKEIRLMLSELLRASSRNAEAREQLEKLASDLEARGDTIGARKTLMRLQALDAEESTAVPADTAKPGPIKIRSADLVFLDTGPELPRLEAKPPSGPVSRKTRAVSVPTSRKTSGTKVPSGLPLIEVSEAAEEPPVADLVPLEIETSSLTRDSLQLESVQPISEEARMEASASGGVARTLGFEPTQAEGVDGTVVQPLEGLELDEPAAHSVELTLDASALDLERSSELGGLLGFDEVASVELERPESPGLGAEIGGALQPGGLDSDAGDPGSGESAASLLGLEPLEYVLPDDDAIRLLDAMPDEGAAAEADGIGFVDLGGSAPASITELEDRVLEDPDDPEAHRALGEALLAEGEQLRGQEELELALSGYETREDWHHADDLIHELIRLDPNGVRYHQKRVEIGFRSGDRARLVDAYLELADALLRVGALDKALAVYRRVSEHDPGNQRALAALDALHPVEEAASPPLPPAVPAPAFPQDADEGDLAVDAMFESAPPPPAPPAPPARRSRKTVPARRPPEPPPEGDFVDLGALVRDDEPAMDPRMQVRGDPTGDEQRDFQDMLSQFKRGIDQNIDAEDYESHYDLGVAFKEMGLLDEAISEFQKALRAPESRLKTSEALGSAFYEKGQYAIAEAILRRAVESLGATDDEQIGLIYWMGRSQEAQGKIDAAIPAYERVMAVDIGFQDTSSRVAKLSAGRGQ